jgi:hypothetical protein
MYMFCIAIAKIKAAVLLYKVKDNSGTSTTCTEISQLRTIHYSVFPCSTVQFHRLATTVIHLKNYGFLKEKSYNAKSMKIHSRGS